MIVFDWDGTLMDSAAHIVACLQTALTDLELPEKSDDEIKNIIGLGLREALHVLCPETNNEERSEERRVGKECRSRWSPYH